MSVSSKPIILEHDLVLLCEGKGDCSFFEKLLEAYQNLPKFTVIACEGVSSFADKLKAIRGAGYSFTRLKGILIVADSGNSPGDTFKKVKKQVQSGGKYPLPSEPMKVAKRASNHPAVAVMLLPDESKPGGLETLYVQQIVQAKPWVDHCVETFLRCGESTAHKLPSEKIDKARFHCLVALTNPEDPSLPISMACMESRGPFISVKSQCFDSVVSRLKKFCEEVR